MELFQKPSVVILFKPQVQTMLKRVRRFMEPMHQFFIFYDVYLQLILFQLSITMTIRVRVV